MGRDISVTITSGDSLQWNFLPRMGIQMVGDDRCLDSIDGRALYLQEGQLWHDALRCLGLHLWHSDPHQMRRGEWF